MKVVSTLLTGGLVVGGLIAFTAPSQAAFTTHCVGEGGPVTVPGDLVVPADESCSLDGTTIQGDVRVQAGADLLIAGGAIEGNLVVQQDGFAEVEETSVGGNVTSRGSHGVFLVESTVAGNYTSPANAPRGGFLLADRSDLSGRVADNSGSILLVSSTVAKQVNTSGNVATDIEDSVVEGRLTVTGAEEGALLCDSEVHGAATYAENAGAVQIGGTAPWTSCAGTAYIGGDLSIDGTTGGVHLFDTIVRGDLSGEGNDPAPVGADNRVRGTASGQFADLAAPSGLSAHDMKTDRIAEARAAAQERTLRAEAQAAAAGDANL